MPLTLLSDRIALTGTCPIEEAEPLLDALRATDAPRVDLGGLDLAHTAVLQVLMAIRPGLVGGMPTDPVAASCLAGLNRG